MISLLWNLLSGLIKAANISNLFSRYVKNLYGSYKQLLKIILCPGEKDFLKI